jgi:DNA-binding NarL/FixJ family response regulator
MEWLERRERRRQEKREREREAARISAEAARLRSLTPGDLAEKVRDSELRDGAISDAIRPSTSKTLALARRFAVEDTTRLARQIGQLSDRERYILALVAEGYSVREIADRVWEREELVRLFVRRIIKDLRREESPKA